MLISNISMNSNTLFNIFLFMFHHMFIDIIIFEQ